MRGISTFNLAFYIPLFPPFQAFIYSTKYPLKSSTSIFKTEFLPNPQIKDINQQ